MLSNRFSNLEIMNLIKYCESKYPVDTWTIGNIHIWPLIRNNLPGQFININSSSAKGAPEQKNTKIFKLLNSFFVCIFSLIKIFIKVIFSKKCEILLVSDGVSYTKINNIWVDRFCDPIVSDLKENKRKCFLLAQLKSTKTNTLNNYESIQHIETLFYYVSRLKFFIKKPNYCLSSYNDFLNLMNEQGLENKFSQNEMTMVVNKIKFCSFFFDLIIRVLQIKKSFIVCYYGTLGYALALASHKNNIEFVDIEHGSIFNCPAYCGWSKVPDYGYELLPTKFELWHSILNNEFIASNSTQFKKLHKAKVNGLRVLGYLKKNKEYLNDHYLREIKKKYKHLILVTLQPQFYGLNDWDKLAEVVKLLPKNWGWIVRSHPAYKNSAGMEKMLSICQDNVIYDNADLNLYEILEYADCLITTASASCLEAMMFNVPILFISEVAIEDFSPLIEQKFACYTASSEQIMKKLKLLLEDSKRLCPYF